MYRWLNGNRADAEDAFNTAALAIWRKTHEQTPTIVNPMGWLTGLVRHACLDLHRKRQQEANQTVDLDLIDIETWTEAPPAAAHCHSPEAIFLQREQVRLPTRGHGGLAGTAAPAPHPALQ